MLQTRVVQGALTGTWGEPALVVAGQAVTITGRATGTTVIRSWQFRCLNAWHDPAIVPTPTEPVVLATSEDSNTPSFTFTPPNPGSYLILTRAWSLPNRQGEETYEYRVLSVRYPHVAGAPPPVVPETARAAILAQAAAGNGMHDNWGGYVWGWGGPYNGPMMGALFSALEELYGLVGSSEVIQGLTEAVEDLNEAVSSLSGRMTTVEGVADGAASTAATANSTANSAASAAQAAGAAAAAAQADIDAVTIPDTLAWSTTIECERSGFMEFPEGGTDASQVFTAGTPPYRPGAVVEVLIRAGRITGAHTVTVDSTIGQASELATFDPSADYWLLFVADTAGSMLVSATSGTRPTVDVAAPLITAAVVADSTPDRVTVTTNEATTWVDATGFALTGYTLGAVTGSGTTHYIAISPPVAPGASVGPLTWDGTNTVVDGSLNALASGSRSVTNNVTAPTIQSASIVGSVLTLNMSESCSCGGVTGLSLAGTAETITSLTSGSGTATLVFALSGSVTSGTITFAASAGNLIADAGGTALAAVSDVSVSLAAPPEIVSAEIDGTALVVAFDEAVTQSSTTNWSALVGGVSSTVTYASGSGTTAITYTTSVAAVNGDTVTVSATAPTGHASTATGVALAAFAGQAVTNNTVPATQVLYRDDFDSLDDGWTCDQGAAGMFTVSNGNAVEPTPVDYGYHVWRQSDPGVTLPADYEVEFTVQHDQRHRAYYGLCMAIVPTADHTQDTGIRLWRSDNDATWRVGSVRSWNADDVTIDVTMPASWETDQLHTICLRRVGSTVTVWIDGTLSGTLTGVTVNQGVTGTHFGWCGDPYGGGFAANRAHYEVRSVAS